MNDVRRIGVGFVLGILAAGSVTIELERSHLRKTSALEREVMELKYMAKEARMNAEMREWQLKTKLVK